MKNLVKSQRTSIEAVRFGGSRDGIAPTILPHRKSNTIL